MSYNTKNYTEQGGETTHIGGKLVIDEGGSVEGLPSADVPVMDNQVDSTAETLASLVEDFNSLLSKLKAAGLMEADSEDSNQETEPVSEPGNDDPTNDSPSNDDPTNEEPNNEQPNNDEPGSGEPGENDPPVNQESGDPE